MSTYKCDSCRKVYKIKAKPYMCNNCDFIYCKSCYKKLPYEYKDSRNLEFCPRCEDSYQKVESESDSEEERSEPSSEEEKSDSYDDRSDDSQSDSLSE